MNMTMAHGTDKRTDAGLRNEKDGSGGGKKGRRKKGRGRNGRGMKRERENEQKHIREYGRADELPPGRFHRSRCYPRRMTVRERGRERARDEGMKWLEGGGGGEEEEEDMAEERTTDVAHYANVSRYVVQRKQTEPEAPTPYTHHASHRHHHPLTSSPVA